MTVIAPSTDSDEPAPLAWGEFHQQHPQLWWSATGSADDGTTGQVRITAFPHGLPLAKAVKSGWYTLSGDAPVTIEETLDLSGAPYGTTWTFGITGQKLSGEGSVRCQTRALYGFTP